MTKLTTSNELMLRAATGRPASPKTSKSSTLPALQSSSISTPPTTAKPSLAPVMQLTSNITLKLLPPKPLSPPQSPEKPKSVAASSWAAILPGKSPTKSINSPPKITSPIDLSTSPTAKSPVTINPFAPKPGDPVHPFFMSPEARKEHRIKENQIKLQAEVAKRSTEIRSQTGSSSAAMNAFFAPRARPNPTNAASPANPEIRAKYAQYGTHIPDFPLQTHILPTPASHVNMPPPTTLRHLQLDFDSDSDSSSQIALTEPAEFLSLFGRTLNLSGGNTSSNTCKRSELLMSQEKSEADIASTAAEIFNLYDNVRYNLGMKSTKTTSKPLESSTDGVPLLDVRAEDMAAFLAQQQQAAAQRQVEAERRLLASRSTEPAYTQAELQELYRTMLKQASLNFALPWSSRFSPQSSRFVCGNSMAANSLKDWLIKFKAASETQESTSLSRNSSSSAMSSFFQKKTPSASSLNLPPKSPPPSSSTSTPASQSQPKSNENSQTSVSTDSVANAFVLYGPIGSGKTSAVYAVASELGFSVLEINASMKRSGANLRTMVEEATQSKHVGRDAGTLTILLFEEVDLTFAEDAGFFQALVSLCESTKRPIVLTCQSVPAFLQSKLQSVSYQEMRRPDEASIFAHFSFACLASGLTFPPPNILHQLVLWFEHDLRRLFNDMQFWTPYLSAFGWNFSVRALAGLIVSSDPSESFHCLNHNPMDSHSLFRYSESRELPDSLDLLHRHFLLHHSPNTAPITLEAAKMASEAIAVSDMWHPTPLYDEADTTHDTQWDLFASLQRFTLSVDMVSGDCANCSSCYSLGTSNHMENIMQLVEGVSGLMVSRNYASSSKLNSFDNITYLSLLANIEDEQRLQNTKRRQFKSKIDWSRVSPLQRLRFVSALKLSPVPPEPRSPPSKPIEEVGEQPEAPPIEPSPVP